MNRLIIISGDIASGRSELADFLSQKMRILSLKKENIFNILKDTISVDSNNQIHQIKDASSAALIYAIQQATQYGGDLILDANFTAFESLEIRRLCLEKNYQVCLIVLTGNKEFLYRRYQEKTANDVSVTYEQFSDLIDQIRVEDYIFPQHRIDVTNIEIEELLSRTIDILQKEFMM